MTDRKKWLSDKIKNSNSLIKLEGIVDNSKEWISEKLDESSTYNSLQDKLSKLIDGEFEATIVRKKNKYETEPDSRPTRENVNSLIKICVLKNAKISGGSTLIPGPWGMVAVAPEIALVIKNQIDLIYDIGVANGKQASINKELLAGIALSALGSGAAGLLVMHGGKVLVKRSSLRVFQKIIALLAGKVTQQALKSSISKWLPIAGAAFMAWLSGHITQRIGNLAHEIFQKEIEISESEVDENDIPNE